MTRPSSETPIPEPDAATHVTPEVGDEGGSPGDVEVAIEREPVTGSEASETLLPAKEERRIIIRDSTGSGRRSP